MNTNISKHIFIKILSIILFITIIIGLLTRFSIHTYEFYNIYDDASNYIYYPFNDLEYANGYYKKIDSFEALEQQSDYIIRGTVSRDRDVLEGCIKTVINCNSVLKGELSSENISIYEPINLDTSGAYLFITFDGYNCLKEGNEYLFFLKETDIPDEFMYVYPAFGKFPLDYSTQSFAIIPSKDKEIIYSTYQNFEQVFQNQKELENYLEIRKIALELLK